MDNKDIIPLYREDIDENSILVMRRRKRKKKRSFFKMLLCLMLIIGACSVMYKNFDKIENLARSFLSKIQNEQKSEFPPSFSTDSDGELTDDNIIADAPSDTVNIPKDAIAIIENSGKFTEVCNETELTLDLDYQKYEYTLATDVYKQYGNEAPLVLIIHSACMESYSNGVFYHTEDSFYRAESNVATVGKVICEALNKRNIKAIHIDDIFSNGSIYKSRAEFEKALDEALRMYPSISYVFDISRDILINDDLTMDKMITSINGSKMAQIKITVGSSSDESSTFWHKNLAFAQVLANECSDLIYNVTLCDFELSQNIKPISMRLDIGAYSNSIDDAILAGEELADNICNLLHQSR